MSETFVPKRKNLLNLHNARKKQKCDHSHQSLTTLMSLDTPVILHILHYLDLKDLLYFSSTCKNLKFSTWFQLEKVTSFNMKNVKLNKWKSFLQWSNLPIRHLVLNLENKQFTNNISIGSISKTLETLVLTSGPRSDQFDSNFLSQFKNLKRLEFRGSILEASQIVSSLSTFVGGLHLSYLKIDCPYDEIWNINVNDLQRQLPPYIRLLHLVDLELHGCAYELLHWIPLNLQNELSKVFPILQRLCVWQDDKMGNDVSLSCSMIPFGKFSKSLKTICLNGQTISSLMCSELKHLSAKELYLTNYEHYAGDSFNYLWTSLNVLYFNESNILNISVGKSSIERAIFINTLISGRSIQTLVNCKR
jgi:hypothetical protein